MNSTLNLKGKGALVTGVLTGIGLAVAHEQLETDASAVVTGLDAQRGNAVIREANAGASTVFCIPDVHKDDQVATAFAEADCSCGGNRPTDQ